MTVQQSDIQWYIARDGKQHGPLSDVEMRTFVAQGHLKPTDLIWRPGFADWRPAPTVFPFQAPEAQAPQPRAPSARPSAAPAQMASPAVVERSFEPSRIRVARDTDSQPSSRRGRVLGAAVLLVLVAAGGGWYVWQQKGQEASGETPVVTADGQEKTATSQPVAAATETAPAATQTAAAPEVSPEAVAKGAAELDAKFQQTPMWNVVKREFPDWYNEQLKETAKLTAENKPQLAINKHLAEALVALRRQHAKEALAASTDKLKSVASAFLANLKSLGQLSIGACYGFISQGETAPVVLQIMQSPDQGASVRAQITAIFEAIADGRKSPTTHARAVKQDYEVLVQQLTKLGWSENDLKIFSNPSALSREPPERVCKMVQDWFVAHLAVQDKATQERLLVETLKPVVSG
jgi:GYF domain 2